MLSLTLPFNELNFSIKSNLTVRAFCILNIPRRATPQDTDIVNAVNAKLSPEVSAGYLMNIAPVV